MSILRVSYIYPLASILLLCFVYPLDAQNESCDLLCPTGTTCIIGAVDHPATLFDNSTLDGPLSSNDITWTGPHCLCPEGMTGLLCEIPYDSCDEEHKCYNNGKCIPGQLDYFGNDQLFCDCEDAVDSTQGIVYVGKHCEHAVLSSSKANSNEPNSCQENPNGFCLNGGTCNDKYP